MLGLDGRIRDRISVLTPDRGMVIGFPAEATAEDVEHFRRHLEAQPLAPNVCRMQIDRGPTTYPGVERMHAALFAVLDLHKPDVLPPSFPGERSRLICSSETQVWGDLNDYTDYPCETVLAIAAALGIEVADA